MSDPVIEKTEEGFSIQGEMSLSTINRLLSASSVVDFSDQNEIRIDLSRVSRADSAGLALLLEWLADARRGNCDICFSNMPEQMRGIARVTELDALLPLCE